MIKVFSRRRLVRSGAGWATYRLPTEVPPGYVMVDRREVFLHAQGVVGEEPADQHEPAMYLGHVLTCARVRTVPVPDVVATWQSSEDADP